MMNYILLLHVEFNVTNSMKQSLSLETYKSSSCQEMYETGGSLPYSQDPALEYERHTLSASMSDLISSATCPAAL
jgi:hypothetical protein